MARLSKADTIQHLFVQAVSAVKTKGIYDAQHEIYRLVDAVVVKKRSVEPLHTSEDIQSQTYLKLLDWLKNGKKGKRLSVEEVLNPHHIRKTASSFGFSGAKYSAQVCRLEDWTPIEHLFTEPAEPDDSKLLDIWLKYSHKLDQKARQLLSL